ncbi:ABC transporter substrate-binding protein [Paenibacillus sp. NPDC058177]|uniref:ABC transporter substrate-binding protein n=1 Tax=Paenibacillus sp. NPDC058177 TaxID=3346369 RepID=UPI0036DD53C8
MKQVRQSIAVVCMIVLMGTLLLACSSKNEPQVSNNKGNNTSTSNTTAEASSSPEATSDTATKTGGTHSYTDYRGHTVEIPDNPQKIVFFGETYGDLLTLGVQAIGAAKVLYENQIYEDKVQGVEDVGLPISLEKTLDLQPDLIIYSVTDEADFEALSKIAPTVIFDTFAPLKERMLELGTILGKTKEAESWLAQYKVKEAAMWEQLKASGMKPGETASVFTYYPGDRLFVMATTGLSQVLYEENGFKPTPLIQKVLDDKKGFEEISMELLKEYAGDRIFILNPVADEAKKSTEQLISSQMWKNLPAVKNGYVYFQDIEQTSADASTRDWLLQQIPNLISEK